MSRIDSFIAQIKKHKADSIIKNGKSLRESYVYCPYCAHEQDSTDVWESGLQPNSSEHEYECVSCEQNFIIEAEVLFSTSKKAQG